MGQINLLDTRTSSFGDLLGNGKIYRVPLFQRDYSWQEENWEDLWQDILTLYHNPPSSHYMGSIVLQNSTTSDKQFTIIDGQHRIAAFKKSFKSFDIPASVYINISKEKMIEIFRTVNSTQKPVNPSLRLELESESFVYNPEKFAVNLAKRFIYDYDSPLKGRIQLYGDEELEKNGSKKTLSFYAFATEIIGLIYNESHYHSIKNFLYNNEFSKGIESYEKTKKINSEKYIFWKYYSNRLEDRAYKILFIYFNAIKDILPLDWNDSNSILLKSIGIRAIMKLFIDIYEISLRNESFKKEDILEIISPLSKLDGKINNKEYFGSSFGLALKLYKDMKVLLIKK